MKRILSILFLFIAFAALCQNGDSIPPVEEARILSADGFVFLEKGDAKPFDKVQALGKFRKSQQVLNSNKIKEAALRKTNNTQIHILTSYFSGTGNIDSLRNTTRFYPDSIFQTNAQYSQRFKAITSKLLNLKKRATKENFFGIDGLNYISAPARDSLSFILNFENYWPLEIIEFEKTLKAKESQIGSVSKKQKEELLYSYFKINSDSLEFSAKRRSLEQSNANMRQLNENKTLEAEALQQDYTKLRNIAAGIIGLILLVIFFTHRKNGQLLRAKNQDLLEEKKRSEELLLNILPAEVAKDLKNKASSRAHKYEAACVLFSDFKNFSKATLELQPEELVAELDYYFSAFDNIVDKYRLQKIKTIGDAYMCVGGLYTQGTNHINRMVQAALEMQLFLESVKKRRVERGRIYFEARIGIHTGPIVAGVVGKKKFAFDIWGDTVNVAQQMETNGTAGKVNISGETYKLIEGQFECTHRGKVLAKNSNEFEMYFVDKLLKKK